MTEEAPLLDHRAGRRRAERELESDPCTAEDRGVACDSGRREGVSCPFIGAGAVCFRNDGGGALKAAYGFARFVRSAAATLSGKFLR